jgi:hypothetical protein
MGIPKPGTRHANILEGFGGAAIWKIAGRVQLEAELPLRESTKDRAGRWIMFVVARSFLRGCFATQL